MIDRSGADRWTDKPFPYGILDQFSDVFWVGLFQHVLTMGNDIELAEVHLAGDLFVAEATLHSRHGGVVQVYRSS